MSIPTDTCVRILVVDDHAILRQGLRMLVEAEARFQIVGEAENRAGTLALASSTQPDVVLLDLDLGDENGLDLIQDLLTVVPHTRILVLTGLRDTEAHRQAFRLGARGLVVKEAAAQTLLKAIRKVYEGEVWLDRANTASLLSELSRPTAQAPVDPEATNIARLSARELEVTALIGEGLSNKRIADRMCISETTVRHHLTSIFGKLHVRDRLELLLYAYRHKLLRPPAAS